MEWQRFAKVDCLFINLSANGQTSRERRRCCRIPLLQPRCCIRKSCQRSFPWIALCRTQALPARKSSMFIRKLTVRKSPGFGMSRDMKETCMPFTQPASPKRHRKFSPRSAIECTIQLRGNKDFKKTFRALGEPMRTRENSAVPFSPDTLSFD